VKKWIICIGLCCGLLVSAQVSVVVAGQSSHRVLVDRVKKAPRLRVLFIGNSYSYHIPKQFETLARGEGRKVEVKQVTKGGWTLKKHAASKVTLKKIANGHWDVVVLQEQSQIPSFQEDQRKKLMDPAVRTLVKSIRQANAIPVFFQTWGRKNGDKENAQTFPKDTYQAMQKRLIRGYSKAAEVGGGVWVVPVGQVWSEVRASRKGKGLYAKDGSHPAAAGNYLGACVFYVSFYDTLVKKPSQKIEGARQLAKAAGTAVCRTDLSSPSHSMRVSFLIGRQDHYHLQYKDTDHSSKK